MINILNILLIIIAICFVLFFFFLGKGNKIANRYFAIFIILLSFQSITNYLFNERLLTENSQIIGLEIPIFYLIPPVYFFLIKSFINIKIKFKRRDISHVILFLAALAFFLPLYFVSIEDKQSWIEKSFAQYNAIKHLASGLFYAQFLIYVYIVLKYLRDLLQSIKTIHWIPEKFVFQIKQFSYITLIYLLFQIAILFMENNETLILIVPLVQFLIVVLLFKVLLKTKQNIQLQDLSNIINDTKKYGLENLSESDKNDILQMVNSFLTKEKNYLYPNYTITGIAIKLKIPVHHLAEAIYSKYKNGLIELIIT